MSDEHKSESERIAELEREVAELRDRLETHSKSQPEEQAEQAFFREGDEGAGAEAAAGEEVRPEREPEPSTPADPGDQQELARHIPSRRRAIVIGVCVGVVALTAIIAIVLSLSQVITPLSKSAAGALEPFEAPAKKAPVKATKSPLRAPGL